jgi:putative effector of murein hydrolase LrgA (UPF0299 family)
MNSVKPTATNVRNLRTALAFASIAAVFFVGIIVAHAFGGPLIGVSVMGAAVLLFLVVAIGRNLRK